MRPGRNTADRAAGLWESVDPVPMGDHFTAHYEPWQPPGSTSIEFDPLAATIGDQPGQRLDNRMKFRFTPGRRNDRTPVARDDAFGTDRAGRTALHYAVINDPVGLNHTAGLKDPAVAAENFKAGNAFRLDNTKRLLTAGADPNASDNVWLTPLHLAANGDSVDVVQLLIDAGADVNAVSEDKQTPLYITAQNTTRARYVIAEALLAAGADPTVDPAAEARIYRRIKIVGDTRLGTLLAAYGFADPTAASG